MAYTYKEFLDICHDLKVGEVEVFVDTVPASGAELPAPWVMLDAVTNTSDPYGRRVFVIKRSDAAG
jgi:hypothetical protein